MARYVLRDGQLVLAHLAPRQPVARSHLPCPAVRADGMDAIRSHADGRLYDSRSAYEAGVKAAGCEIVGNDTTGSGKGPEYRLGGVRESLKQAMHELGGS